MRFFKYQAAGNDFVMIDESRAVNGLSEQEIKLICDRRFGVGADGVIFLRHSDKYDFEMVYHNSDGKEATMCGNGGRSIVRFAENLGYIKESCRFLAIDGEHSAVINHDVIRLKMIDVQIPESIDSEIVFTGSPHFVQPVTYLSEFDVVREGRKLRFDDRFAPEGCNVNFIESVSSNEIYQRTYERGVEDETLACGTGAVAGAVFQAIKHNFESAEIKIHMRGGELSVSLTRRESKFVNVWLCGPASLVFAGEINL